MKKQLLATLFSSCLLGVALAAPNHPPPPRYVLTDLGEIPGGEDWSVPSDINDAGVVVGASVGPQNAYRAFRWVNGVIEDLGDLPFSFDVAANGVNNPGEIVGVTGLLADEVGAFLWSNGVMDTIYSLPEYNFSKANSINDSGLIVGSAQTWEYENLPTLAYLWSSGTFIVLGTLPGTTESWALDINNAGQVVGHSGGAETSGGRAFIWSGGAMQALPAGSGRGFTSHARAINNVGAVVGWAQSGASSTRRAAYWKNGTLTELGKLQGSSTSAANDINDAHHFVVGFSQFSDAPGSRACLWIKHETWKLYDLNTLKHPRDSQAGFIRLERANAINESGWIVAAGEDLRTGKTHAYLLKPAN